MTRDTEFQLGAVLMTMLRTDTDSMTPAELSDFTAAKLLIADLYRDTLTGKGAST